MSPQVIPGPASAADDPIDDAVPSAPRGRTDTALVVLQLGPAEFALPIRCVREVLRTPRISRVPFTPPTVCGVFALRGEIIPVVDLGMRLFKRPAARPGSLVIVSAEGMAEPAALLVDAVSGLIDAESAQVREPPAEAEATLPAGWVTAVVIPEPGRLVTLLALLPVLGGPQPGAVGKEPRQQPAAEHG